MRNERRMIWVLGMIVAFLAGAVTLPGLMIAGDLNPPAAPGPTMKTLDEIPPVWSQKLPADDGDPVTGCGSSRFECVLDGGAVLDKETGLVWEQFPVTLTYSWASACSHCYRREVDRRTGWRLPTIEELASLVDTTQSNPALPEGHPFENVQSSYYWSSSTYADNPDFAWFVYFLHGNVDGSVKDVSRPVWCVRGGHGHDAY